MSFSRYLMRVKIEHLATSFGGVATELWSPLPHDCILKLPCKKQLIHFVAYLKNSRCFLCLFGVRLDDRASPLYHIRGVLARLLNICYLFSSSSRLEKELNKKIFITHYFMSVAALIKISGLSIIVYMSILGKETHSNNILRGFWCTLVRGILIDTKHFYVFLIIFCWSWLF